MHYLFIHHRPAKINFDTFRIYLLLQGHRVNDGYTNWSEGEPNNKTGENCLEYSVGMGTWNDISCYNNFGYICKKNTDEDIFNSKTDTTASVDQCGN